MSRIRQVVVAIAVVFIATSSWVVQGQTYPATLTNPNFQQVWERQDLPVDVGAANRSWTWGPRALTIEFSEEFAESPEQQRTVQYFDKGRMEVTTDPNDVTRGLLPVEMIRGAVQVGFNAFQEEPGAEISVVGDPGGFFPTYADLDPVFQSPGSVNPELFGQPVTRLLNPDGSTSTFAQYASDLGTILRKGENGHGVPQAFLDFQNATGIIYEDGQFVEGQVFNTPREIFGMPVTEPYWVNTVINNQSATVMFQVFERRVLTYNPTNLERWRVEMGNVGLHYLDWRYGQDRPPTPLLNEQPLPEQIPTQLATATSLPLVPSPTVPTRVPPAATEQAGIPTPTAATLEPTGTAGPATPIETPLVPTESMGTTTPTAATPVPTETTGIATSTRTPPVPTETATFTSIPITPLPTEIATFTPIPVTPLSLP